MDKNLDLISQKSAIRDSIASPLAVDDFGHFREILSFSTPNNPE
jgi:hypothetical protein